MLVTTVSFTKFVASFFFKLQRQLEFSNNKTLKSLCFVAPHVTLSPTTGLKLNQISTDLFFFNVNYHLILFIRKRLFEVACNTFPLKKRDYLPLHAKSLLDGYVAEHKI